MAKLTSKEIHGLMSWCLFRDQGRERHKLEVEGILPGRSFVLHRVRLEARRGKIEELLCELSDEFRRTGGGGASFLEACVDRHGVQWTDRHKIVEILFVLGIAIDKVKFCAPREAWHRLPGGMPFLVIDM